MSLEKMMSLHPLAKRPFDELALAARHAGLCNLMCTSCADACLAEVTARDAPEGHEAVDLRQCIRLCLDCADVCQMTAREATRLTAYDADIRHRSLELAIAACEACATECERHDHEHCKLCATMCRECAEDCRKALASI